VLLGLHGGQNLVELYLPQMAVGDRRLLQEVALEGLQGIGVGSTINVVVQQEAVDRRDVREGAADCRILD
jgi:hypothetical protein